MIYPSEEEVKEQNQIMNKKKMQIRKEVEQVWEMGKQRRVGDDQCGVNILIRGREKKVQDRKEDYGDGNGHDGTRDDNADGKENGGDHRGGR